MSRKLTYQEKLLQMGKRQTTAAGQHVVIGLIVIVLFIIGFQLFFSPDVAEVEKQADSEFAATFVGDMMFGRNVEKVTKRHSTAYLFDMMKPYFDNADCSSGNFDNLILQDDEVNYEKR